jgi:hypothetical protein
MRTVITTLALALLVGCSGDNSNSPKTIEGTYTLSSIAGDNLPALIYSETNYTLEITAGAVNLNADGTFSDTYTIRENDAGTVNTTTIPCTGSWNQTGDHVSLIETVTADCGDTGSGTWDGSNSLTIDWGNIGLPAVHTR